MGRPVITVASGGRAVVDVTSTAPMMGLRVTESTNGFGMPVTKVAAGKFGMPVMYAPPITGGGVAPVTYTTWNPADQDPDVTLSNGSLTATIAGTVTGAVRGVAGKTSGKYYFEVTMTTWANTNSGPGIALATAPFPWNNTNANVAYVALGGTFYVAGTGVVALGASTSGQVIGIAVDRNANLIWARKAPAGNWDNNVAHNPATGAGGYSIASLSGALFPALNFVGVNAEAATANFGASAFSGAVPSGFTAGWPA